MSDSDILKKRNRELKVFNSIARELNATVNLSETLQKALTETLQLMELETGWIYLLDDESGEMTLSADENLPPGLKENSEVMEGPCNCQRKFANDKLTFPVNVDSIACSRLSKLNKGNNGLKYHTSIPLYTRNGAKLGILNLARRKWHKMNDNQLNLLNTIADFISVAVERSKLFEELQRIKQNKIDVMEHELQAARDMQMSLLPDKPPKIAGIELSAVCVPSREVGGDYYNYLRLDDNKLAIVLSDVSGKGMQGATIAMRFNEILRYEVRGVTDPAEILKRLDKSLLSIMPPTMFITAGIAVLDTEEKSLNIASAANPEIYHYSAKKNSVRPLEITGLPLGILEEQISDEPFKSGEVLLEPGDAVVFTSDGVEEARDEAGSFYGRERLSDVILRICGEKKGAEEIRAGITEDLKDFTSDSPQSDDITIIVLSVDP
ncbi:MAG: GAF domain-containing SpoIIE family protein phosphatase [Candidatus Krumholzibacteriota bacterium]|nr:GAF domain-containing SpoIIE family protein phosphatase [Candidatus Krumholzibacteriota bacterium]